MKRRILVVLSIVVLALTVGGAASAHYTKRGTVTRVVDGDTLEVAMRSGEEERVRLVGIGAPELAACYGAKARARAARLAAGRDVVVRGDPTQAVRDRYGRLLGYVRVGSVDLARNLILGGLGRVYVHDGRPFERVSRYREAERVAQRLRRGLWGACARPATGSGGGSGCHPSYTPCLPIAADLDCPDVRAMGKAPVRVGGSDPYRLDGDGDGWGCE
jgi:micrococcal nuclease